MATAEEIKAMKRPELNKLAAEQGLNPDDFKRADELKSALLERLRSAQAEAKAAADEDAEAVANTEASSAASEEKTKSKPKVKPARPRIERRGKRYRQAAELIDKTKAYALEEAVQLLPKTSTVKFDASVELHINLGVDPKQADQTVRGTVVLPHGTGATQRVAVLAPEAEHSAAKDAGADIVGLENLLEAIDKGQFDFDILVAHPSVMAQLGRYAKLLGPKGLMPNPKSGTVTTQIAQTVSELKSGRIEFRIDRYGIIHQTIGKASFKPQQLSENVQALVKVIVQAKPATSKGVYMPKVTLTTTMGPGIKLDTATLK